MIDHFILGQLAIGVSVGMTYAVIAIGLTLIFRVLSAVNFAHGDVYTIGAFATLIGATTLALPLWAIVPLVLAVGGLSGWTVERLAFRPVRRFTDEASLRSRAVREATLLSSLALGIVVREALDQVYKGEWLVIPASHQLTQPVNLGGVIVSTGEIAIAGSSILLLIGLQYLLHRTRIGIAIRAVSSNLLGAQFSGIDINRVIVAVFIVASILGAAAGMVVSLTYGSVQSFMGLTMIVKGFVVMVVGGLTSIPGAVVAGLLVGVAEAAAGIFVPSAWTEMVGYGLLLMTLLFMPRGLFGRRQA
ncbi:branched-chain amino acid ABC transporter permease [Microbaculum marinum]|uniref:Branched-chain amino acid ABC transporter permease n=1 Tax=Microbaculum marinum TaxID=1764581 RepID=A0AAW9RQW9_9HYPH